METQMAAMANQVQPGDEILLEYTLSTEHEVIDTTEGVEPLRLKLGSSKLHPAIEKSLIGKTVNEPFSLVLDPSIAFGEVDPTLKVTVAKKKLPEAFHNLKIGDSFEAPDPKGRKRLFKIIDNNTNQLVIDGNHPLAGQVLYLEARILKVFV